MSRLGLGFRDGGTFLAPLATAAFGAAIGHLFLTRVKLGALFDGQDGANLRLLLRTERRALRELADLFHVGAEGSGVTLLSGGAGRFCERLALRAQRFLLRL